MKHLVVFFNVTRKSFDSFFRANGCWVNKWNCKIINKVNFWWTPAGEAPLKNVFPGLTYGVVYSLAMWKILLLNANLENNESCGIGHLGQRVLHKGKKKVQMRFNKLFIFRTNCETAIGTAGLLNWGLCDKTKQKLDMSSIDTENSIQEKKNTFFKKLTFSLKKKHNEANTSEYQISNSMFGNIVHILTSPNPSLPVVQWFFSIF